MKTLLILGLVVLLAGSAFASSMERNVEMELDGKIDYITVMGGEAGEVVVKAEGEGKLELEFETEINSDSLYHHVEGSVEDIEVISGVKTYDNDLHVTKLNDGEFKHEFDVLVNTFPVLSFVTADSVTLGEIQRVIDIKSGELKLYERFAFYGTGWINDWIVFNVDNER